MQVDDASADDVMAQLLVLESQDPDRDIIMYINSPGGSFTAMTAIYDTMQYISPQIQTVVLGQAASAAAVLLAAGAPGKRLALPNARILIHQPADGRGRSRPGVRHRDPGRGDPPHAHLARRDAGASTRTAPSEQVNKDIDRDKILVGGRGRSSTVSSTRCSPPASALPAHSPSRRTDALDAAGRRVARSRAAARRRSAVR